MALPATTQITLSSTAYTDLGAGPLLLAAIGGPIAYQIGASLPSATSAGYSLKTVDVPVHINTTAHVWAIQVDGIAPSAGSALVSTVTA
jgi:hypothetical protein